MHDPGGFRAAVAAVLLAVLVSGCGAFGYLQPPIDVLIDQRGVAVLGKVSPEHDEDMAVAFDAYFPSSVQVHPGDEIIFEPGFTGMPHTLAFGTLVDRAVEKLDELPPDAPLEAIEALPEMQALPSLFPKDPGDGPPRLNRSAAEPCFLDTGAPPTSPTGGAPACPERGQPTFTGEQTFYSSGWVQGEERFRVTIDGDTEPGTYAYICLVHRSAMTGQVEVVDEERNVPTKAEVSGDASDELDRLRSRVETSADEAAQAATDAAVAGGGAPWTGQAQLTAFFPEEAEIGAGETIRWRVSGMHTISLQPDVASGELLEETGEGVALNPDVVRPSEGAPAIPAVGRLFPPPAGGGPVTIAGSWDGAGSFNSGLLWSVPPVEITYELTFTEPGTYELRCLVHPDMRGTVTVGG